MKIFIGKTDIADYKEGIERGASYGPGRFWDSSDCKLGPLTNGEEARRAFLDG